MLPFIDIITTHDDKGGSKSCDGEKLQGITRQEVRLLGLGIITVADAAFVKETRLLGCLIKRRRLKGWDFYHSSPTL